MSQRWWYLRRGVAWQPVLGCLAAAVVAVGLLARWPSSAVLMLPALLAALAAGAAFLYDEPAVSIASVTPRGSTWRGTTRLLAALFPLALWAAVIALRPGDLPLSQPGWLLLGAASILLATGIAALAVRPGNPTPGPTLAGLIAIAVLAPVVTAGFLGFPIPFPLEGFPDGIRTFWVVVACVAALACAAGSRGSIMGAWSTPPSSRRTAPHM